MSATSTLSEDVRSHLGSKRRRLLGVPQELRERLVSACASFQNRVEDHLEPARNDISRLVPTAATENTNCVFDKLR